MDRLLKLTEIDRNKKAIIRAIKGGHGLVRKLDALGIREGKEVIKVSSQMAHGPVVLRSGNTDIAIGFGMAQKIIVELL